MLSETVELVWFHASETTRCALFTTSHSNDFTSLMNNERKIHKGHIAMCFDKGHTILFKRITASEFQSKSLDCDVRDYFMRVT